MRLSKRFGMARYAGLQRSRRLYDRMVRQESREVRKVNPGRNAFRKQCGKQSVSELGS